MEESGHFAARVVPRCQGPLLQPQDEAPSLAEGSNKPPTPTTTTKPAVVQAVGAREEAPADLGAPPSPSRTQAQVGGRLAFFSERWRRLFPDSDVADTLQNGVLIQFMAEKPPLTTRPVAFPTSATKQVQLQEAVQSLLVKQAIEPVQNPHSPGFYSRLFTVPKSSGGLRPVIDLSVLNRFIWCPHFQMETAVSIKRAIKPGEWVTSVDLSDAYLHVPLSPTIRKYFRFVVRGQAFQFKVLPFGLCTAPREFTKLLQPVLQHLRSMGIRVHAYLDDWAIRARSRQQGHSNTGTTVALLEELGWLVNYPKSELEPRQEFVFVGLHFDTIRGTVAPHIKFLTRVRILASALRRHPTWTARMLHSLVGILQFMAPLVHRGRMHLREVQRWIKDRWSQAQGSWSDMIQTDAVLHQSVVWWTQEDIFKGVPLQNPPVSVTLCTDSSTKGWGAHMGEHTASGVWSPAEQKQHINALEMKAVLLALQQLAAQVAGQVVRLCCDNSTVVAYLRKEGGTRADHLTDLTRSILEWCDSHRVTLLPVHLAGVRNVTADALSRRGCAQPGEWELHPSLAQVIFDQWGLPLVDMFATRHNRRLPIFVSPMPDDMAWETDALSLDWSGLGLVYAFPPGPVIQMVLDRIAESTDTKVILIAPDQPLRPWYPDLIQMRESGPWVLPLDKWPLRQKVPGIRGWVLQENPQLWNLAAWLVSGHSYKAGATTSAP